MNFRKLISAVLAAALVFSLSACGGGGTASGAAKDYAQILHDARPDDYNEAYAIFSPDPDNAGQYLATDGYSADMDAEGVASQAQMVLQMLNLTDEDLDNYAVSLSLMNIKSYAVAILLPAEGRADAVTGGLQAYLDAQKMNMQTYLPDQYEIASSAQIVTAPGGEIILVCCEDSDTVLASIQSALKS